MQLDTPRKLYQHNHRIAAGCTPCKRWHEYAFPELDRLGLADRSILRIRFRCTACGKPACKQIRTTGGSPGGAHRH